MVRIRLRRVGSKKQPSYRIVVTDSRSPRDGRYIEIVGFYNPRTEPATMSVKEARVLHWLSVGAQPSEPVERILVKLGTRARFERLRAGEELDALAAEAEAEIEAREAVSPKTRYPARAKTVKAPTAEVGEEAAEAATEAVAEDRETVSADNEAEETAEPAAEAEAVEEPETETEEAETGVEEVAAED